MHVLIIGGDGMIGTALTHALRAGGHDVTVTSRRSDSAAVRFDLTTPSLEVLPIADVTVICAAMARFADCRTKPELARQINVTAPAALAAWARKHAKRVILLSTSAVFDCLTPKRRAEEAYSPRSAYGRFKAEAEAAVLRQGAGMSVLRLTKIVHPSTGIFSNWIKALKMGETITAFEDHTLCPLPIAAVVEALDALVTRGSDGIYQVSGEDDISYTAAARELALGVGVPETRVHAIASHTAGLAAEEVTPFTSLDTERLAALTGATPPKARDVLRQVYGSEMAHSVLAMVKP